MINDSTIIAALCDPLPGLKAATIEASDTPLADRSEALATFLAFPGQGWLCTSESKHVYLLPDETPGADEYPLHGERADGKTSLHLRQDGAGGWILTTLREVDAPEAIVFESQLAAYDPALGKLRYQVCHEALDPALPHSLSDLTELRPARARFLGFHHVPHR